MRNILAHIPQKEKERFAAKLKEIWLAHSTFQLPAGGQLNRSGIRKRFSKAIAILEEGLEDSLSFYTFPKPGLRKIASTNSWSVLTKRYEGGQGLSASSQSVIPTCDW
jgi:transposase-like protein